jgi:hypothetical protein
VTAVLFSLRFLFFENESASPNGRASMVFCSASSLFRSLLLTKASIFLFYSFFVITNQEKKMRDRQRHTLNRSSIIISRPPLTRLASSNNVTSHSITAAAQPRIVSKDHNPKQRQQCDITHFLPHKTDQRERTTSMAAARLAKRLESSQEQD